MKEKLKIYIERLRDGKSEEISEVLAPSFMEVNEKEMRFEKPITLSGEAYVTDEWLILNITIEAEVTLFCSLCNDPFAFTIRIENMMHEEPLENIRDATFDLLPLVRETILLEIPFYPQCGITACKKRNELEPYLKKEGSEEESPPNRHMPFKDIL